MKAEYGDLALQVGQLLGLAQGMNLKVGHLSKQGIELVFEGENTRTRLSILPQVYTEGKVIIDAINDLTMVVQLEQTELATGERVGGGRVELPY
jgi:hypothetical protein